MSNRFKCPSHESYFIAQVVHQSEYECILFYAKLMVNAWNEGYVCKVTYICVHTYTGAYNAYVYTTRRVQSTVGGGGWKLLPQTSPFPPPPKFFLIAIYTN